MEALLHRLFEDQCLATPAALAVKSGGREFTYSDIEARANRLARYLRAQDIAIGELVAIYFRRSELPIIAILAILKAGAAYVPIDRVLPEERIRHILADAGIRHLLTEEGLQC